MNKLIKAREEINRLDREMASLFSARMDQAKIIGEHKVQNTLPVLDASREVQIIKANSTLVDESIRHHYIKFIKATMEISRSYQVELYPQLQSGIIYARDGVKCIHVSLGNNSYDIFLGCGVSKDANDLLDLERRVLILTDTGVPSEYAQSIAEQCKTPFIYTIEQGEASKSINNFEKILSFLTENRFTRSDCVVAVGGGVVGDLAGFVAASYMRGIDFYNVPTTLLSQVDSSIGGKVAINLGGYKNTVGAFYQPRRVLIDPELLLTLDIRQIRSGLAEALKMATTSDPELFEMFESGEYLGDIEKVIERSLLIKRGIVERDERESGERRILNFGHTIGHAIESRGELLHGECVALGMLYMCSESVRARLAAIIDEMGLPTGAETDDTLYNFILRDKKADGDSITIVYVNEIGKAELRKIPIEEIRDYLTPKNNGGIQ